MYTVDPTIDAEVRKEFEAKIREAVSIKEKLLRYNTIDELTDQAAAMIEAKEYSSEKNRLMQ